MPPLALKANPKQQLCERVCVKVCTCTYVYVWHAFPPWMPPAWGQSLLQSSRQRSLHRGLSKAKPSWSLTATWTGQSISTENVPIFKHTLLRGNAIFYGKYTPIVNNKRGSLAKIHFSVTQQIFTHIYLDLIGKSQTRLSPIPSGCVCLPCRVRVSVHPHINPIALLWTWPELCALASVHVGLPCSFQA